MTLAKGNPPNNAELNGKSLIDGEFLFGLTHFIFYMDTYGYTISKPSWTYFRSPCFPWPKSLMPCPWLKSRLESHGFCSSDVSPLLGNLETKQEDHQDLSFNMVGNSFSIGRLEPPCFLRWIQKNRQRIPVVSGHYAGSQVACRAGWDLNSAELSDPAIDRWVGFRRN